MGRHCKTGYRLADARRYAGVGVRATERAPHEVPPPSARRAGEEGAGTRENAIGVTDVKCSAPLLVEKVRLAQAAELLFIIAPACRNFLDRDAAFDLLPQHVGARKDVDWHLLVLVFVWRLAPFEADRVE